MIVVIIMIMIVARGGIPSSTGIGPLPPSRWSRAPTPDWSA